MSTICRYSPPDVTGRCNLSGARKCKTCKGGSTMIFHQSGYKKWSSFPHYWTQQWCLLLSAHKSVVVSSSIFTEKLARSHPTHFTNCQLLNFIAKVCPIWTMPHTGRIWINGTLGTARNVYLVCLETFSALQSRPVVWKTHGNSLWLKHESVSQFRRRSPSR